METPQQPTANYWNNGQAPTWMGPLAYYNNDFRNEDMEGQFRTGLSYVPSRRRYTDSGSHTDPLISLTSGPGFNTQPARTRASPEDSLFEINQTGLSPMWYDKHPLSSPPEPHAFLGGTLPRRTLTRGWDVRPCQLGHRFPFNT